MVKIGGYQKSSKLSKNGQNGGTKMVQKGQKWSKMVKNGPYENDVLDPNAATENFDRGAPDFLLPRTPCFQTPNPMPARLKPQKMRFKTFSRNIPYKEYGTVGPQATPPPRGTHFPGRDSIWVIFHSKSLFPIQNHHFQLYFSFHRSWAKRKSTKPQISALLALPPMPAYIKFRHFSQNLFQRVPPRTWEFQGKNQSKFKVSIFLGFQGQKIALPPAQNSRFQNTT